ncbi:MAG TPA: DUF2867 domain-containing protein [Candidatus Elarobacter sp.]
MPQISRHEYEALPLRAHKFLAGIPLHDAWAVELPRTRGGVTLDAYLRTGTQLFAPSPIVRALLRIRYAVGRPFGWDRAAAKATAAQTFADRLTADDRARSLVPAGTRDGAFHIVYRFENEQLSELINATAHAAALSALVETETGYRFYLAVYVRAVTPLTPVYLALVDPFRKLIVYPSLLRGVRTAWTRALAVP